MAVIIENFNIVAPARVALIESVDDPDIELAQFEARNPGAERATFKVFLVDSVPGVLGISAISSGSLAPNTSTPAILRFTPLRGNTGIGFHDLKIIEEESPGSPEKVLGTLRIEIFDSRLPEKGKIGGRVTRANGSPFEGVIIQIGGTLKVTDSSGIYLFQELEPGNYQVRATKQGFTSQEKSAALSAGEEKAVNFVMQEVEEPPEEPEPEPPDFIAGLQQGIDDFLAGLLENPWVAAYRDLLDFLTENFGINLAAPGEPENKVIWIGVGQASPQFQAAGLGVAAETEMSRVALTKAIPKMLAEATRNPANFSRAVQELGVTRMNLLYENLLRFPGLEGSRVIAQINIGLAQHAAAGGPWAGFLKSKLGTILAALGAVATGIFAVTALPNLFLMTTFARTEIPQNLNFAMKPLQDTIESLFFTLDSQIRQGDVTGARTTAAALDTAILSLNEFVETGAFVGIPVSQILQEASHLQITRDTIILLRTKLDQTITEHGIEAPTAENKITFTIEPGNFELLLPPFSQSAISPLVLFVPKGNYSGTIRAPGFKSFNFNVFESQFPNAAVTKALEPEEEEIPQDEGRITYRAVNATTGEDLFVDWFIDGELRKSSSTFAEIQMPAGKAFETEARRDGFVTGLDVFVLVPGINPTQTLRLQALPPEDGGPAAKGLLKVNANIPAVVTIPGQPQKTTPAEYELSPGTFFASLRPETDPELYETLDAQRAFVRSGETATISVIFTRSTTPPEAPPAAMGQLRVEATPSARVIIAGITESEFTPVTLDLLPGSYDVVLQSEGFGQEIRRAFIRANEETVISAVLEELPEAGDPTPKPFINVISRPPIAKIIINGIFTGKWTTDRVFLRPGTYILRLEKSGFLPFEQEFTIPGAQNG